MYKVYFLIARPLSNIKRIITTDYLINNVIRVILEDDITFKGVEVGNSLGNDAF